MLCLPGGPYFAVAAVIWALSSSPISSFSPLHLCPAPRLNVLVVLSMCLVPTLLTVGLGTCCSLYLEHTPFTPPSSLTVHMHIACSHLSLHTTPARSLPWPQDQFLCAPQSPKLSLSSLLPCVMSIQCLDCSLTPRLAASSEEQDSIFLSSPW